MSDAPADRFEASTIVAHRYRVLGYRGDRGFGQVYEAHDSALERRVALMRMNREFSRPDARESFFDTRSSATVGDPRVVDLCDYGEDVDGRLFLVMPWIEDAEALDELLAREGALAWPRAKSIIEQIAGALEAAHQNGVLHGGLEPSRVLIDKRDGIHIVDFGLAPALASPGLLANPSGGSAQEQADRRRVTFSGPLPGRIEYLSPEQVRGEAVDTHSDIYALGVMLWELVSGTPPFVGDPVTVAEAHLDAALPELQRAPGLPAEIEPLLHLALTKEPGDRIASAAEFLSLLQAIPGAAKSKPPMLTRSPTQRLPDKRPTQPSRPPPAPVGRSVSGPASAAGTIEVRAKPTEPPPPPAPVAAPNPQPVEPALAGVPQAIDADFDPSAPPISHSPTPPPRKRRLGKLELAIIVFLAFDLLLFATWKLFANTEEPTVATAQDPEPKQQAKPEPKPQAKPEQQAKPQAAAVAEQPPTPAPQPASDSPLSVEQAIAAELPPEPQTPGPVRPMANSLSDKAFREAVVGARSDMLDKCLDSRMRRTLKVSLKVGPSGKVEYARVLGSLADTSLGQCVVKQVYQIEFPPTYEGGSHTYTLRLR